MVSFLDLPREIRDLIYDACLTLEVTPPTSPLADSIRRLEEGELTDNVRMDDPVSYPEPLPDASISLLRTSRQVRFEVLDAISRLRSQGKLAYKLDCMSCESSWLIPTWVSIPVVAPSLCLDSLDVDIRVFEVSKCREPRVSKLRSKQYGFEELFLEELVENVSELLVQFFQYGPSFMPTGAISVDVSTISLNVHTPHVNMRNDTPAPMYTLSSDEPSNVSFLEEFAWSIGNGVMDSLTDPYGWVAFSGRVKLLKDGRLLREWGPLV